MWYGIGIAIATIVYLATSPNWSSDSYTAYFQRCEDRRPTLGQPAYSMLSCPSRKFTQYILEFKAIPESQVVVTSGWLTIRSSESHPMVHTAIAKRSDCAVLDKKNWECGFSSKKTPLERMEEGEYFSEEFYPSTAEDGKLSPVHPQYQQIGRFKYNFYELIHFISGK